jgi:hypothetical protein
MFHQKLRSNLFIGFPSWILESIVLPARVDLFLQGKDPTGQPMGGHTDSCQALVLQKVDFVGQSGYLGEFEWSWLFTPGSLELGESANKRGEIGFMVLAIEPCPMPSLQGSFQSKVQKDGVRAGLKTYAPDDFLVRSARLILQEKVVFEQRKVRTNSSEGFAKMNKDDDLKDGTRVEID